MRTTISVLSALLALSTISARAQGAVNFSTLGTVITAPINPADPNEFSPVPVVNFSGPFFAGLYYAPAGETDESAFVQAGASVPFGPLPGLASAGTRTLPGILPREEANIQVRAWNVIDPNCTGRSDIITITAHGAMVPPLTNRPDRFRFHRFSNELPLRHLPRPRTIRPRPNHPRHHQPVRVPPPQTLRMIQTGCTQTDADSHTQASASVCG